MTKRAWLTALAGVTLAMASTSVSASTVKILHDESRDGDLGDAFFPLDKLGDLSVGQNVIRGSIAFSGDVNSPFSSDVDTFAVFLKAGQTLETSTVTSEFTRGVNVAPPVFDLSVGDEFGNEISGLSRSPVGQDEIFAIFVPFEGQYFVRLENVDVTIVDTANPDFSGEFSYEISLDVSGPTVIPLPASLPLLGAGLLGMAALSRRRRRAA